MIDDFISELNSKNQAIKLYRDYFKVKNGCYIFLNRINSDGYPAVKFKQKTIKLHRFVYEKIYGVSVDGKVVRHTCDNPACINPLHLKIGTHADNVQDRVDRDRSAKGEQNGRAKLTEDQVFEIRGDNKRTVTQLAHKYEVCRRTIRFILDGVTWAHI